MPTYLITDPHITMTLRAISAEICWFTCGIQAITHLSNFQEPALVNLSFDTK